MIGRRRTSTGRHQFALNLAKPPLLHLIAHHDEILREFVESGVRSERARACAETALPFTSPKLAVTTTIEGKDFAALLDRAVARVAKVRAIEERVEEKAEAEPISATPILPVPDKRFRR